MRGSRSERTPFTRWPGQRATLSLRPSVEFPMEWVAQICMVSLRFYPASCPLFLPNRRKKRPFMGLFRVSLAQARMRRINTPPAVIFRPLYHPLPPFWPTGVNRRWTAQERRGGVPGVPSPPLTTGGKARLFASNFFVLNDCIHPAIPSARPRPE